LVDGAHVFEHNRKHEEKNKTENNYKNILKVDKQSYYHLVGSYSSKNRIISQFCIDNYPKDDIT